MRLRVRAQACRAPLCKTADKSFYAYNICRHCCKQPVLLIDGLEKRRCNTCKGLKALDQFRAKPNGGTQRVCMVRPLRGCEAPPYMPPSLPTADLRASVTGLPGAPQEDFCPDQERPGAVRVPSAAVRRRDPPDRRRLGGSSGGTPAGRRLGGAAAAAGGAGGATGAAAAALLGSAAAAGGAAAAAGGATGAAAALLGSAAAGEAAAAGGGAAGAAASAAGAAAANLGAGRYGADGVLAVPGRGSQP